MIDTATPAPTLEPQDHEDGAGWGQKTIMLTITVVPFVAFVVAIALLWNLAVGWTDLLLLVVLYVLMGLGVTVGFHRMLTHQAFEAIPPLKATLLVLGSMSLQGSAITWAVDHRTHHATKEIPACMVTGQAAGTAAALAVQSSIGPKHVDIGALRDALRRAGAIL